MSSDDSSEDEAKAPVVPNPLTPSQVSKLLYLHNLRVHQPFLYSEANLALNDLDRVQDILDNKPRFFYPAPAAKDPVGGVPQLDSILSIATAHPPRFHVWFTQKAENVDAVSRFLYHAVAAIMGVRNPKDPSTWGDVGEPFASHRILSHWFPLVHTIQALIHHLMFFAFHAMQTADEDTAKRVAECIVFPLVHLWIFTCPSKDTRVNLAILPREKPKGGPVMDELLRLSADYRSMLYFAVLPPAHRSLRPFWELVRRYIFKMCNKNVTPTSKVLMNIIENKDPRVTREVRATYDPYRTQATSIAAARWIAHELPNAIPVVHECMSIEDRFRVIQVYLRAIVPKDADAKADIAVDGFYLLLTQLGTVGAIIDVLWNLLLQCLEYETLSTERSFVTRLVTATMLPFVDMGDILATIAWTKFEHAHHVIDDVMDVLCRVTHCPANVPGWPLVVSKRHVRNLYKPYGLFLSGKYFRTKYRHVQTRATMRHIMEQTGLVFDHRGMPTDEVKPRLLTYGPEGMSPMFWAIAGCRRPGSNGWIRSRSMTGVALSISLHLTLQRRRNVFAFRPTPRLHRWIGGWAMADIQNAFGGDAKSLDVALANPDVCSSEGGAISMILPDPTHLVAHPAADPTSPSYLNDGPFVTASLRPSSDEWKSVFLFGDPDRAGVLGRRTHTGITPSVFNKLRIGGMEIHKFKRLDVPTETPADLFQTADISTWVSCIPPTDAGLPHEQIVEEAVQKPSTSGITGPAVDTILYHKEMATAKGPSTILEQCLYAALYNIHSNMDERGGCKTVPAGTIGVCFLACRLLAHHLCKGERIHKFLLLSLDCLYRMRDESVMHTDVIAPIRRCVAVCLAKYIRESIADESDTRKCAKKLAHAVAVRLILQHPSNYSKFCFSTTHPDTPSMWVAGRYRRAVPRKDANKAIVDSTEPFVRELITECRQSTYLMATNEDGMPFLMPGLRELLARMYHFKHVLLPLAKRKSIRQYGIRLRRDKRPRGSASSKVEEGEHEPMIDVRMTPSFSDTESSSSDEDEDEHEEESSTAQSQDADDDDEDDEDDDDDDM